jgi:hypothetical protein
MENSIAIDTLKLLAKNHSETWSRDIALKGLMNILIMQHGIKTGDSIVISNNNNNKGVVSGVLDGGLLIDLGHVIVDIRDYKNILQINNKTITL